jgi:hypothetical protein
MLPGLRTRSKTQQKLVTGGTVHTFITGQHEIAARSTEVDEGLPEVGVGGRPAEVGGPECEPDRPGGRDGDYPGRLGRHGHDTLFLVEIEAIVAGGCDDDHALLISELGGLVQRPEKLPILRPGHEGSAEAHVDDVQTRATLLAGRVAWIGGVQDALDHILELPAAGLQDLHADNRGAGSDADGADTVVGAATIPDT